MVDTQVVSSTLELHRHAVKNLLPTPDRTHYLFNLRDFSRVILGVLLSTPESMEDLKAMKRLWVHEAMRVYYDRLVDDKDKSELFQVVLKTTQAKMKENFSDLFRPLRPDGGDVTESDMRCLNYCDFMEPGEDDKFYRENTDIGAMRDTVASYLEEYNKTSRKPMDLVLFNFALEHLCRLENSTPSIGDKVDLSNQPHTQDKPDPQAASKSRYGRWCRWFRYFHQRPPTIHLIVVNASVDIIIAFYNQAANA